MTAGTATPRTRPVRRTHPVADPTGAAAGARVVPVRTRRSWQSLAGAVAAILAGGLLAAYLFASVHQTVDVFTVNTTITRGATITAGDLSTLTVTPGQHINAFTTSEASQVVGRVATVTLPKGSLITSTAIAAALPVAAGEAIVGVAVKPSEMPATALSPGDQVVITPIASQTTTVTQTTPARDVTATVVDAPDTDATTGLVVVDVSVPQADASDLAGRAAAGQVALYLAGSGK